MFANRANTSRSQPWTAIVILVALATSWMVASAGPLVGQTPALLDHAGEVATVQPASIGFVTGAAEPCIGTMVPIPPPTFYGVVSISLGSQLVAREVVVSTAFNPSTSSYNYWLSVPAGTYQVNVTNGTRVGEPPSFPPPPTPANTVSVTGGKVTVHNIPNICM